MAKSFTAFLTRTRVGSIIKSRVFIATTAVATGALIAVGVAQASIPDANGIAHGCVKTALKNGVHGIKMIDTAETPTCPAGVFKPLDWQTDYAVWGGIRANGFIPHHKHITNIIWGGPGSGYYAITFDRHVDNCSLQVTARYEGGGLVFSQFKISPGSSSSEVIVRELSAATTTYQDGDFDILGMCPRN